jgi:hypothetical protein
MPTLIRPNSFCTRCHFFSFFCIRCNVFGCLWITCDVCLVYIYLLIYLFIYNCTYKNRMIHGCKTNSKIQLIGNQGWKTQLTNWFPDDRNRNTYISAYLVRFFAHFNRWLIEYRHLFISPVIETVIKIHLSYTDTNFLTLYFLLYLLVCGYPALCDLCSLTTHWYSIVAFQNKSSLFAVLSCCFSCSNQ